MNVGKLRAFRTNLLILIGFALIVAGLWVVLADLFGVVVGAGAGMFLSGVAVLVLEGLSE